VLAMSQSCLVRLGQVSCTAIASICGGRIDTQVRVTIGCVDKERICGNDILACCVATLDDAVTHRRVAELLAGTIFYLVIPEDILHHPTGLTFSARAMRNANEACTERSRFMYSENRVNSVCRLGTIAGPGDAQGAEVSIGLKVDFVQGAQIALHGPHQPGSNEMNCCAPPNVF